MLLQSTWRGWRVRRRWPLRKTTIGVTSGIGQKKPQQPSSTNTGTVQRNVTTAAGTGTGTRPRPQPIAGTPPPDPSEKCADQKMIQQTCTLFGLDLVSEASKRRLQGPAFRGREFRSWNEMGSVWNFVAGTTASGTTQQIVHRDWKHKVGLSAD
mgnify:CR=1 FL=1